MAWKTIKKLEKTLVNNNYSQTLEYLYLIFFLTALSIIFLYPQQSQGSDELQVFGTLICMLISFWGFQKSQLINRTGDNSDFYKKFFSLSLITGLRVFGGLIIISFLLRGSRYFLEDFFLVPEGPLLNGFHKFLIIPVVFLVFFIMLTNAFRRVNEE